jgi:predicted GTPase
MLKRFFRPRDTRGELRMVIGINQVDRIIPGGWNTRLNFPTKEAERQIQRKCEDIVKRLSSIAKIDVSHIEYYSALKKYRLGEVLERMVRYSEAGFRLGDINPKDPFDDADADVKEEVSLLRAQRTRPREFSLDDIVSQIASKLSGDEQASLLGKYREAKASLPRIAIVGKTGVGKSTTVNAIFNANLPVSDIGTGTTAPDAKDVVLPNGSAISIVDLPGYGRTLKEDKRNEQYYRDIVPQCDLVFLIIQADTRDLADDEEMATKFVQWIRESRQAKV